LTSGILEKGVTLGKWLVLFLLVLVTTACDLQETPVPAATRRPTRTPAPFAVEPTAIPASTRAPSAAPSAAPTIDPTAELCPLTGVRDPGKPWTTRRPLVIKVDNSPLARPQSGIAQADIVIEHYAEGGVTRFDAVFWCSDSDNIGPIRSARIIDFDLVTMFQAMLVHVGASNENLAVLKQMFGNRLLDENEFKAPFHRIKERDAPYNTYTSSQGLWVVVPQRGITQTGVQLKGLTFADAAPAGGKPAAKVTIPYDSRFADSVWELVPDSKLYKKSLLGDPLVDANTKQQVQAANVVVIFAQHTVTEIIEDSLGSRSIKIDLQGHGRAVLFRDGQAFDGQWVRADPNGFIRFVDAGGKDLPLKIGRSWYEVVPSDFKLEWK
jgi:hypothetical protein